MKNYLGISLLLLCILLVQIEAKRRRSSSRSRFDLTSDERMCHKKKCGRKPKGSWCQVVVNKQGRREATCVCPTSCNVSDVSPVCSVYGRQYDNKCLLHLEACRKRKNIKISYEGPCIASQAKCRPDELRQFPFRLLDWFVHLKDVDQFGAVDPRKSLVTMENSRKQEVATWKFKDLDKNSDGKLNKKELKQFRFSLMPLEHCAKDFFKICDSDKNKKLQADEWQSCLVNGANKWFTERSGSKLGPPQSTDEKSIQ